MVDLVYYLTNLLFCGIQLLYYYIKLASSTIFCPSSGDIYLFLVTSMSTPTSIFSFSNISELFYIIERF